ncbi:dual specificity protein kinase TTK-like [Antedon mediterranea]|uniref:dual specificity protein kinase TTK-like n=1 Tax=Antedon mediterranea TaxID=105859 RepID=UPI003AF73E8B
MCNFNNDKSWLLKIAEDGNQPEDWLEYLKVIEKRENSNASTLNVIYNKAIRDIPVYKHKKNDNYATILINSARLRALQDVDEARTLFKFSRANIRFLARIHVAAAQLELDIGDTLKCRSVLRKGIDVGAAPIELLKTALARLKAGEKILNPQCNGLNIADVAGHQIRYSSHDHSEDSTNTASYLEVDPAVSLKKRQRNPSGITEDTDSMLKQMPDTQHASASNTLATTHKIRKLETSTTSLLALQQRISALKANSTSSTSTKNLTAELKDCSTDKDWLNRIAEDGNKPEDWLKYLKVIEKRENSNASTLNIIYNKAIRDIPVYKHKKNDNYATILINSARLNATQDVDEARRLFKFARANVRFISRIHIAAAQLELDTGDTIKCRRILCKAIEVGATPIEYLKTAQARLEDGEKILNPQCNGIILADAATNQQTVSSSHSMQMNSSDNKTEETDTMMWLKRQKHLSQSASKQSCVTPLTKPPVVTSTSTAGKHKMRSLGAPMRVKRDVLPNVQEDVQDDDKPLLHGIAPLSDRHSSRSDSSDNTDSSLQSTLPSLTFSLLGRSNQDNGADRHDKKRASCKLFLSPNKSQAPSEMQIDSQKVSAPSSLMSSKQHPTCKASTAVLPPSSSTPHPSHGPVFTPLPINTTPPDIPASVMATASSKPVVSPPSAIKPAVISPPVLKSSPVVTPPVTVKAIVQPPPVVHSAPVVNFQQPPMQNTSKNVIYVNNKLYTILKLVGKGGSSKVYQVYSPDLKNVLAIKRVDLELADDLTKQGYINEITLLTQLQKKTEKIIKLYDFELTDSFIVMVMECGSIDLSTFLRRNKNISEDKIRFYWREMLEAVNVIHQEGIVHSDLKPANFLFVEATLKLIDFGIANAIQVDQTSVLRDQQIGTLNYMSPEAIQDTSPPPPIDSSGRRKPRLKINCRSDVWSLGCILYYMVYGKTPFQHITNGLMKLQAIIDPHQEIHFPAISNKDLHDVLQKCLIRNPKHRPSIDTLLEHPFLVKKTPDEECRSLSDSGTCQLSSNQLQALISQLSSVRVHSPRSMSAISNAKVLIEQLQKGNGLAEVSTEVDQRILGSDPPATPVLEMAPPLSQPPTKQARSASRQPLQSVNMVDVYKTQGDMKQGMASSKHRNESNDKENFAMRESMVNQ